MHIMRFASQPASQRVRCIATACSPRHVSNWLEGCSTAASLGARLAPVHTATASSTSRPVYARTYVDAIAQRWFASRGATCKPARRATRLGGAGCARQRGAARRQLVGAGVLGAASAAFTAEAVCAALDHTVHTVRPRPPSPDRDRVLAQCIGASTPAAVLLARDVT